MSLSHAVISLLIWPASQSAPTHLAGLATPTHVQLLHILRDKKTLLKRLIITLPEAVTFQPEVTSFHLD